MRSSCDLPSLYKESHTRRNQNHPAGVVVEQVEEDDDLTEKVDEHGLDGHSLHVLFVPPELDVFFSRQKISKSEKVFCTVFECQKVKHHVKH